jgi:hypothetical protein
LHRQTPADPRIRDRSAGEPINGPRFEYEVADDSSRTTRRPSHRASRSHGTM